MVDEYERGFVEGMDASSIPATPEGLAAAFKKSPYWNQLEKLMIDDKRSTKDDSIKNFEHGVAEAKAEHTHHKSVYSTPFHRQVMGNVKQLTLLRWSSKLPLYAFIWTWMSIAFIQSSLIYRFSDSSNDAFTRVCNDVSKQQFFFTDGLLGRYSVSDVYVGMLQPNNSHIYLLTRVFAKIVFQSVGEMPPALTGREVVSAARRSISLYLRLTYYRSTINIEV